MSSALFWPFPASASQYLTADVPALPVRPIQARHPTTDPLSFPYCARSSLACHRPLRFANRLSPRSPFPAASVSRQRCPSTWRLWFPTSLAAMGNKIPRMARERERRRGLDRSAAMGGGRCCGPGEDAERVWQESAGAVGFRRRCEVYLQGTVREAVGTGGLYLAWLKIRTSPSH